MMRSSYFSSREDEVCYSTFETSAGFFCCTLPLDFELVLVLLLLIAVSFFSDVVGSVVDVAILAQVVRPSRFVSCKRHGREEPACGLGCPPAAPSARGRRSTPPLRVDRRVDQWSYCRQLLGVGPPHFHQNQLHLRVACSNPACLQLV